MAQAQESGWNRREFAAAAATLAVIVGVPVGVIKLTNLSAQDAPTERQRVLMRHVSQLVLPRTETPGAGEAGVGDFVILALAHGLDGSRSADVGAALPNVARYRRSDGSLRMLQWLENELDGRSRGNFLTRSSDERLDALTKLDAEAFAEGVEGHPWKTIKGLILTGYYTSETGGSKELRYELVPGRWDPDLPQKPGDRAWSSDWTAVDFG
jgi:hypothetical protein